MEDPGFPIYYMIYGNKILKTATLADATNLPATFLGEI